MTPRQNRQMTAFARNLRARQTEAEWMLWQVLRAKRLCGLKFRRQHISKPYVADFACVKHHLVVEIDGGYHDMLDEQDARRQKTLEELGWKVIRFTNEDVLENVDAVAVAIARTLGLEPTFKGKRFEAGVPPFG